MIDVVIVTEYAHLKEKSEYNKKVIEEDNALVKAFTNKGLNCKRIAWEDSDFDWSTTKIAIIKTTWNYFYHIEKFKAWVEKVSEKCTLINDKELIIWNMNKLYLLELERLGITIPATYVLDKDVIFDPDVWLEKINTNGFVVKPVVSGGSKDTYLIKVPFDKMITKKINTDIKNQVMIVQPFVQSIVEKGETSMVFINGDFTHAMVKKPKSEDFRVQEQHGGSLERYTPSQKEISFGKSVLTACSTIKSMPVYARIDFCYGMDNELLLMELEVIEPELWYPKNELAIQKMVSYVMRLT